jgi:hypothetical protein
MHMSYRYTKLETKPLSIHTDQSHSFLLCP